MKLHQDVFDFEHVIGDKDALILRIIGSFTAFRAQSGAWSWDYHYSAQIGDIWLKEQYIDKNEAVEIEAAIDRIITLRVGALTIEASSLE